MKRITKATSIKVSPHTLRHTHSALLISQNQPLKAIAKRLGNTEQVLSEHYGHVINSVDESVMKSFNDALNSGAKLGGDLWQNIAGAKYIPFVLSESVKVHYD